MYEREFRPTDRKLLAVSRYSWLRVQRSGTCVIRVRPIGKQNIERKYTRKRVLELPTGLYAR